MRLSPAVPVSRNSAAEVGGATGDGRQAVGGAELVAPGGFQTPARPMPHRKGPFTAARTPDGYEIVFNLGEYRIAETRIDGIPFSLVEAVGETGRLKKRGYPELPAFRVDLELPAGAVAEVAAESAAIVELAVATPVLSAGFVSRDDAADSAERPTVMAALSGGIYPADAAVASEPFQIRRRRGVGIVVYPFQYLADSGMLRVHTSLTLAVKIAGGSGGTAVSGNAAVSPEFERLADLRFINAGDFRGDGEVYIGADGDSAATATRHVANINDAESLLLVVPVVWRTSIDPFMRWKKQRGIRVFVAEYGPPELDSKYELAARIQALYDAEGISQIMILADSNWIPPLRDSTPISDTLYTLLDGSDEYHDAFISRICANSAAELEYQLAKAVDYEKSPLSGDQALWYRRAMFVASAEGATKSAFKKNDKDILEAEVPAFEAYGYTTVHRVYDPGATVAQVNGPWNAGCGYILYLGHGTYTGWVTTGFKVSDVNALANGRRLPFVLNANCENGYFSYSSACMAEAMMGAGNAAAPAGAIGVVAATSTADWDPPIVLTWKFNELLLSGHGLSAGAMTFAGVQAGMDYCAVTPDEGATALTKLMRQIHLFGDSTLGLRTQTPVAISVAHSQQVGRAGLFETTVTDTLGQPLAGMSVCLYHEPTDTQIAGRTDANGRAVLATGSLANIPGGAHFLLTVYGSDLVPFQGDVPVAEGDFIIYTPATLPPAFVGEAYSYTHAAVGGTEPYAWSAEGEVPPGLALDPESGVLSGSPLAAGQYLFTVHAADAADADAWQDVAIQTGFPVQFGDLPPPSPTVGEPYDQTLPLTGSFTPFAVTLTAGPLPPGLVLDSGGRLHGMAEIAGTYPCAFAATDTRGRSDDMAWDIIVLPANLVVITTALEINDFVAGVTGQVQLKAIGGDGGPYQWTLAAGDLPGGLGLSALGILSGTPAASGAYVVRISAQDSAQPPRSTEEEFTINVQGKAHFIGSILPDAFAGVLYRVPVPVGGTMLPLTVSEDASQATYQTASVARTFVWSSSGADYNSGDGEFSVQLPFAFSYYGRSYSEMRVGANGYVVFGGAGPNPDYSPTAAKLRELAMIAPFWSDISFPFSMLVEYGVFVELSAQKVTVRWKGTEYYYPYKAIDVALTLHPDGTVVFHYNKADVYQNVVAGVSGGVTGTAQVVLAHSTGGLLQGWSGRSDLRFTFLPAIPDWLTLLPDATLTGTPPAPGSHTVALKVSDAAGNVDYQVFALSVVDTHPADTNQDGDVDSVELLAVIALYRQGLTSLAVVESAIGQWQNPPPWRGAVVSEVPAGVEATARTGEILVVELSGADAAVLAELVARRYDIAGRRGERITLYCTAAEYEWLLGMGLDATILDRQTVPGDDRSPAVRIDGYPSYSDMSALLHGFAAAYPGLCQVVSLGKSVQNRDLWAVKISDSVAIDEAEPEIRIISTIHGDEKVGTVMCLNLIEWLLSRYGTADADGVRATALVDATEIWLVPLMNPDGYEAHTRYNAHGIDLNRSFPDGVVGDLGEPFPARVFASGGLEPETAAIVDWTLARNFAQCASLHTGELVVAYPYGNNEAGTATYTATPDDGAYIDLSSAYASANPAILANSRFPGGIVNGADWYPVVGELADFGYRLLGMMSITVEMYLTKTPASSALPGLWADNREALLGFLERPVPVLRGRVFDPFSGEPIYAKVEVLGIARPVYTSPGVGDYCRLLEAGVYDVQISAPGYRSVVLRDVPVSGQETVLDVAMEPEGTLARRHLPAAGYIPGRNAHLRIDLRIDPAAPPAELILSESVSAGLEFVNAWELDHGALPGVPVRNEGDAVSWLFWDGGVAPRDLNLILDLQVAGGLSVPVSLAGGTAGNGWENPTLGPSVWGKAELQTMEFQVTAGWNAFNSPLVPQNPAVGALFPVAGIHPAIWQWNGREFARASEIVPGHGYWILCTADTSFQIAGWPETRVVTTLDSEWVFGATFGTLADRQLPDGVDAWEWDAESRAYIGRGELMPAATYWLKTPPPRELDLR